MIKANILIDKKIWEKKLKKPEICDSLESIELAVYKPDQTEIRNTNYKELINQNIDFVLALGLIVSSSIGAALAARIVDMLDQENLKVTFGMLLLIISSFLAYDLFRTPENLFIINYV